MSNLVKEYMHLSAQLQTEREETDLTDEREDEFLNALDVLWYKMSEEEHKAVEDSGGQER